MSEVKNGTNDGRNVGKTNRKKLQGCKEGVNT